MKTFIISLFSLGLMLGLSPDLTAQNDEPRPSPLCQYTQTVGLTDISVEYFRPGKKDREIFGSLVPYGKQWRLGANSATKMTFSTDVTIGGKSLSAGTYAVNATPNKESWTIHFYPHGSSSAGAYMGDDAPESVDVMAEAGMMGETQIETFMIVVDHVRDDSALMHFVWDKTIASVQVEVPTPWKK